ncbi:hypothetical protein C8R44DRAFT_869293 [Mycena epipterygia]|nr:hypothetical protein C8R44DRAFT_869293 [Mycena epipterygia]
MNGPTEVASPLICEEHFTEERDSHRPSIHTLSCLTESCINSSTLFDNRSEGDIHARHRGPKSDETSGLKIYMDREDLTTVPVQGKYFDTAHIIKDIFTMECSDAPTTTSGSAPDTVQESAEEDDDDPSPPLMDWTDTSSVTGRGKYESESNDSSLPALDSVSSVNRSDSTTAENEESIVLSHLTPRSLLKATEALRQLTDTVTAQMRQFFLSHPDVFTTNVDSTAHPTPDTERVPQHSNFARPPTPFRHPPALFCAEPYGSSWLAHLPTPPATPAVDPAFTCDAPSPLHKDLDANDHYQGEECAYPTDRRPLPQFLEGVQLPECAYRFYPKTAEHFSAAAPEEDVTSSTPMASNGIDATAHHLAPQLFCDYDTAIAYQQHDITPPAPICDKGSPAQDSRIHLDVQTSEQPKNDTANREKCHSGSVDLSGRAINSHIFDSMVDWYTNDVPTVVETIASNEDARPIRQEPPYSSAWGSGIESADDLLDHSMLSLKINDGTSQLDTDCDMPK